jgi:thiol-disulfide isomerase/thioredoxin
MDTTPSTESATAASRPAGVDAAGAKGRFSLGLPGRLAVAVLAVAAAAALFWPRGEVATTAKPGTLYDLDGRSTTLGSRLAPVSLVHFWATWCAPCIQEVPALQRLATDLSERHDFAVVMIAVADSRDKVRTFLGSRSNAALFDPNWDVAHRYGTSQVPETYLLVDGRVVQKFTGQTNWDDPAIRSRLAQVAGRAAGAGT